MVSDLKICNHRVSLKLDKEKGKFTPERKYDLRKNFTGVIDDITISSLLIHGIIQY